jgi:hypothetical protein
MPNIITKDLRHRNIDNFLETVKNQSVYFGFSNPTDVTIPTTPKDSNDSNFSVKEQMIFAKKISYSNCSKVIRNYKWVYGTIYSGYDSASDINELTSILTFSTATASATISSGKIVAISITNPGSKYSSTPGVTITGDGSSAAATATMSNGYIVGIEVTNQGSGYTSATITIDDPNAQLNTATNPITVYPFYVINSGNKVYKCLNNNNYSQSTIEPSSTSITPETTSDGYEWKYMYTLSDSSIDKFYTSNWVPVKTLREDDGTDQWGVQLAGATGIYPYHGANPEVELAATNLMLKGRIAGNEGGVILDTNSYSQISIISNPVSSGSVYSVAASSSNTITVNASHDISDSNSAKYPTVGKNIIILKGTGAGQIREITNFNTLTKVVTVTPNWDVVPDSSDSVYGVEVKNSAVNQCTVFAVSSGTPGANDTTFVQSATGKSGYIVNYDSPSLYVTGYGYSNASVGGLTFSGAPTPGTFDPTYGNVLYVENRKSIDREADQIEEIKVVLQY